MDKGVKFVLDNFERTLKLIDSNPEYVKYKKRVLFEYNRIKYIKYTGNMYEHFLKFKGGNHKYADDFLFLEENGILSNESMADYLAENYKDELDNYCGIDDLIVGEIYSNSEISNTFKCDFMRGMRPSKSTNSLVLIAKHNNPLYDDKWTDEGILNYTGTGKIGDQSISQAQNKALFLAKQEGVKVYLFESWKDNEYYYVGEVELVGSPYQVEEPDENGDMRLVLKFPLKRVDSSISIVIDINDVEKNELEKIKEIRKLSFHDIKEKAKLAESNNISTREVRTTYRERNQFIAEHTKERANGICDLCGNEAPFNDKNGRPYLESHHVITLANNGPDAIYNTVAICPNCHRKVHVLNSKEDMKKLEKVILKYLLADNDEENIIKYNDLFKD